MFDEYEKKKRKQVSRMKSILDYGIGSVIFIFGVFFLIRDHFNLAVNDSFPPNAIDKIFGVICVVYGAWRIYRGYQKNYFR
jgi:hypothetical protein